jgi:retron-type reverse transcriptase
MPIKHDYSNLNSRYKGTRGNSIYTGCYRSFSDSSRSEARLAANSIWLPMTVPGPTSCEVLQSDPNYTRALKDSLELFKLYEKRIHMASKKVKETFTQSNLLRAYLDLYGLIDLARGYTKGVGALRLPLYQNLCNPCVLLIAYSGLKRKKASGAVDIQVENVTLASILSLSLDLRSKKYLPAYTKRVFIPKANGKMRPLGIPSSKDKIVQKALLVVLEPLFENVFLDSSHGFRIGRSCHSALKEVYLRWGAVKWFIECDFVPCFDKISHPIVMSIFSQYVDDYWTCNLVNRLLKKGYVHFGNLCDSQLVLKIGTPQGSIISPLICNIFLHELDCFVERYTSKYSNFADRIKNISAEYTATRRCKGIPCESVREAPMRLVCKNVSSRKIDGALRTIRKLDVAARNVRYYQEDDKDCRKIQYVRYADNFILGLISDKKFAFITLCAISNFSGLLGMTLNIEKSGIKHHEKGTLFLGFKIFGNYGSNVKWRTNKDGSTQMVGDVSLKLGIPLERLFERYADRGFFQRVKNKKSVKFVGRRVDKWLFLDNEYEIIQRFNSVIRGIKYYYSCSTYKSVLDRFWHNLKRSAALTIAHKNKKRSAKWAFDKFGKDLTVNHKKSDKKVSFEIPLSSGKITFANGNINLMLVVPKGVPLPITLSAVCSASELDCAIPNCTLKASEWHHIKHRKRSKGNHNQKSLYAYTAKQIPLCTNHHLLVHSGKYDGPSLRKLPGYIPSDFDR